MIDAAIKTDLRDVAAVKTRLPWPVWLLCGLLLGNLMMKRSFAHLGFARSTLRKSCCSRWCCFGLM